MTRVEEHLSAIVEMIARELGSDRSEVEMWKELVKTLDMKRLERTGEIVVREGALDVAARNVHFEFEEGHRLPYNPMQVRAAMARLRRQARRATMDRQPRQREIALADVNEPDYDSTATELWLFGPLS